MVMRPHCMDFFLYNHWVTRKSLYVKNQYMKDTIQQEREEGWWRCEGHRLTRTPTPFQAWRQKEHLRPSVRRRDAPRGAGRWLLRGPPALTSQPVFLLFLFHFCSGLSPQHPEAPGLACPGDSLGQDWQPRSMPEGSPALVKP